MCVTSLLCGPRADLWPFYGFLCKRFSLYIKVYPLVNRFFSHTNPYILNVTQQCRCSPMLADAHISSLGYLCCKRFCKVPVPRIIAEVKWVMELFRCHDNSDVIATPVMTNFHLNTTVVAIFPNVCLWRRSLVSDLVLTLENCTEPPSYARTAYVVAIWPSFLFDSFVIIWATCEMFLGKWFTAPPWQKFPVRLWL